MKLQKLAVKAAFVVGCLLGVYAIDLALDYIWPSMNIPDWILWSGAVGFIVLVLLTERTRDDQP